MSGACYVAFLDNTVQKRSVEQLAKVSGIHESDDFMLRFNTASEHFDVRLALQSPPCLKQGACRGNGPVLVPIGRPSNTSISISTHTV